VVHDLPRSTALHRTRVPDPYGRLQHSTTSSTTMMRCSISASPLARSGTPCSSFFRSDLPANTLLNFHAGRQRPLLTRPSGRSNSSARPCALLQPVKQDGNQEQRVRDGGKTMRLTVGEIEHLAGCEALRCAEGREVDGSFDALHDHQAGSGMDVDALARGQSIAKDLEMVSPDQCFGTSDIDRSGRAANIDDLAHRPC